MYLPTMTAIDELARITIYLYKRDLETARKLVRRGQRKSYQVYIRELVRRGIEADEKAALVARTRIR